VSQETQATVFTAMILALAGVNVLYTFVIARAYRHNTEMWRLIHRQRRLIDNLAVRAGLAAGPAEPFEDEP